MLVGKLSHIINDGSKKFGKICERRLRAYRRCPFCGYSANDKLRGESISGLMKDENLGKIQYQE